MFAAVTLVVADPAAAERFYATVRPAGRSELRLVGGAPATRGLHVGFSAASRAEVDAFWRAGVDAGYADDGPPGPRPQYTDDYYGGFLLDPDGNSAEAVHHADVRRPGTIDHLWVRAVDLPATRAFWLALAPDAELELATDTAQRVSFVGDDFSLSFVAAPTPTAHLRLDFTVAPGVAPAETRDPDGTLVALV